MANPVWESCCACLVMTPLSTMYSLLDQHTLQLFKDCTNIPVPENNQHLSQYICTLCYKQCDMWECFKARCQESFKLRTPGPTIPDNTEQLGQPHTQSLVVKEEPIEYEILGYQIKEEAPTDDTINESDLDAPMEDNEEREEKQDLPPVNQPMQPIQPSQSERKKNDSKRATTCKIIRRYTNIRPKVHSKMNWKATIAYAKSFCLDIGLDTYDTYSFRMFLFGNKVNTENFRRPPSYTPGQVVASTDPEISAMRRFCSGRCVGIPPYRLAHLKAGIQKHSEDPYYLYDPPTRNGRPLVVTTSQSMHKENLVPMNVIRRTGSYKYNCDPWSHEEAGK